LFEVEDPLSVLNGLSEKDVLTVICHRASRGEPSLYHGESILSVLHCPTCVY